jgi:hypothetical protein
MFCTLASLRLGGKNVSAFSFFVFFPPIPFPGSEFNVEYSMFDVSVFSFRFVIRVVRVFRG